MHNPRSLSVKELNDALKEMKTIYAYDPNVTWFGDNRDERCNTFRRVEIHTVDPKTDVQIMLSKTIPVKEEHL